MCFWLLNRIGNSCVYLSLVVSCLLSIFSIDLPYSWWFIAFKRYILNTNIFKIEIQLIYNAVLISAVHSDSVIHSLYICVCVCIYLSIYLSIYGKRHGNPLQYSCLVNPMDRGAWRATVLRVAKSGTWLKRLSRRTHTHTHTHVYICSFSL